MSLLANVEPTTFWAHQPSPWFAEQSADARAETLIILPVIGMSDWGLGHPMDLEETLGLGILKAAVTEAKDRLPLLVAPPVRFVPPGYRGSALFGIDPETAYQQVFEIADSIAMAGFRKLVLFNTSPWNEAFIDVCGRDLRQEKGLQLFCVNLAGLDIDLHPGRSKTRHEAQTLATFLSGQGPEGSEGPSTGSRQGSRQKPENPRQSQDDHRVQNSEPGTSNPEQRTFRPGDFADGIPALTDSPADRAEAEKTGPDLLATRATRLAGLLTEIHEWPPLKNDGRIETRGKF
ncbi:MAG: creatininase family protein [Opitutales bacterium]